MAPINLIPDNWFSLIALLMAFGITYFSIPAIIRLSLVKRLYDVPDARKQHGQRISPLGGMAIFGGMIISFVFNTAHLSNPELNSTLVALFILFITGVKDDLFPLTPYKKVIGQILAVSVLIFQGDVRLVSLYGLLGIQELPYWISVGMSFFFYLGIINSFNFIDGINGLSSGIALVVSVAYAWQFYVIREQLFLILALSVAGAQVAFLRYNLVNAKIFMGDSGSMVIGILNALLTISFLKINKIVGEHIIFLNVDAMLYALAVLIIPVFDTMRVVFLRVFILRRSPFQADRNHIHHALLDLGFSHLQSTATLIAVNVGFILFVTLVNDFIRAKYLLIIILALAFTLSQIPFWIKRQHKHKMNLS